MRRLQAVGLSRQHTGTNTTVEATWMYDFWPEVEAKKRQVDKPRKRMVK